MNLDERATQILLTEALKAARESCLNCVSWRKQNETCIQFNARPPAHVIAFGCPSFCHNQEIPF